MTPAAFRSVVAAAWVILDPLFHSVRHCSLKIGRLVWVKVWVREQAGTIE